MSEGPLGCCKRNPTELAVLAHCAKGCPISEGVGSSKTALKSGLPICKFYPAEIVRASLIALLTAFPSSNHRHNARQYYSHPEESQPERVSGKLALHHLPTKLAIGERGGKEFCRRPNPGRRSLGLFRDLRNALFCLYGGLVSRQPAHCDCGISPWKHNHRYLT